MSSFMSLSSVLAAHRQQRFDHLALGRGATAQLQQTPAQRRRGGGQGVVRDLRPSLCIQYQFIMHL